VLITAETSRDFSRSTGQKDGGTNMTAVPVLTNNERSIWIPYGVCILLSIYVIKNILIAFWGGPGEAGGDPYDKML